MFQSLPDMRGAHVIVETNYCFEHLSPRWTNEFVPYEMSIESLLHTKTQKRKMMDHLLQANATVSSGERRRVTLRRLGIGGGFGAFSWLSWLSWLSWSREPEEECRSLFSVSFDEKSRFVVLRKRSGGIFVRKKNKSFESFRRRIRLFEEIKIK